MSSNTVNSMMSALSCETFVREVEIDDDVVLKIHQKMVGDEGCVVWDAALVMANYLIHDHKQQNRSFDQWENSRVIELGAGTGVVGLTAAVLGADVLLTDIKEYVELMQKNIDCNRHHVKGNVRACTLIWGELTDEFKDYFPKYILVSDCVYYNESLDPLVATLDALSNKETVIVFSYEKRISQEKQNIEKQFFQLISDKFDVHEVNENQLHPSYQCPDIRVLLLTKK